MSDLYIVDDHVIVREAMRTMLQGAGHRVLGASGDVTQALADLQRLQPSVLLLDLNLGERSGMELLEEIGRRALPVRTVVLSMSGEPRQVAEALRLGALGYVLKGADTGELLDAIDSAQQGRRFLGTEVAELAVKGLTAAAGDPVETLSARERQMVALVARGHSSSEIGVLLHLSPKTVDSYRSRMMAKLGVADVPALVRLAIRAGIVDVKEP